MRNLQRRQLLALNERTRRDLASSRVDAEQLAARYKFTDDKIKTGSIA